MILSKDSNSNWTPTATGNGTFVGTNAAFNAVKNSLPNNTVAYITDDGGSIVDEVTNGDMRAVTSNAVYDALKDGSTEIKIANAVITGSNSEHEGGQLELDRPTTYASLGRIYMDSYDNKLRIFGTNSSNTTTMLEIDFTNNKLLFNGREL